MILSNYTRTVLICILLVLGLLLVASCGASTPPTTPPATREAGDTLGLDGGVTTLGIPRADPTSLGVRPAQGTSLGSRPASVTGIGTQQDEDVKEGTLVPREPVEVTFRDLPELADAIDIERILRWSQVIGFAETVIVTAPEGTELPEVITYDEAEFEATLRDRGLDLELELEIESDDEAPIVLELRGREGETYTYTFSEDSRDLTTIRIEGDDVRELFRILTSGDPENSISFEVELDYEIDGNSSIPEEAEFVFEFVTELGIFEVESEGGEEDIR